MKKSIIDFLVPIYGPINAFLKVYRESGEDLRKANRREISNMEFIKRELDYTAWVFACGAVSTLELYCIVDKLFR